MSVRLRAALGVLAWAACASAPVEPVLDLTPFAWTWSQISLGDTMIRYGFPDEAEAAAGAGEPAALALIPLSPGVRETRLAAYRYGCARADRAQEAACTVFLDFWLLEPEPPLAEVTLAAHRARLERVQGDPLPIGEVREIVRDSHGREWYRRALAFESGAAFAHYSLPIDARRALAVTSFTTRAPDRIAARDLARNAIDRAVIAAANPPSGQAP